MGWTSPVSFRNVSDEAYSAVFAVGLHFVWNIVIGGFGYSTDFAALIAVLAGNFGGRGERYEGAIHSFAGHPAAIGLYFLSLAIAASLLGRLAHGVVRKFQWDLQTQIFRFKNEWYYLLTGEALSFKEVSVEPREVDGVYLSAVADHSKDSYLYRGIVEDWTFNPDGSLATISLSNAHRRLLSDDRRSPHTEPPGEPIEPDNRYYKIHGDLFVLKCAEIKPLNLDYFALSDEGPRNTPVALRAVGGAAINDD